MKEEKEIQDRAEKIQQNFHLLINKLNGGGTGVSNKYRFEYQDLFNTLLFSKIAELELKIEKLESNETTRDTI